jgi:hypothetical protein
MQNNWTSLNLNSSLTVPWTSSPWTLTISTTQTGPSRLECQVSRSFLLIEVTGASAFLYRVLYNLVPSCDMQNYLNTACLSLTMPRTSNPRTFSSMQFKAPRSYDNLLIDVSLVWLDSTQNHYHSWQFCFDRPQTCQCSPLALQLQFMISIIVLCHFLL